MESVYDKYEAVIGLEVHIQLLTKSKAYSSDSTKYGALPNTNISPVSLGHPGTLPMMNKKVIEKAVKLGLACKSEIRYENQFARKNYFYADLPKGYQITQDLTPICNGGEILIKDEDGNEKPIHLTRIHMEEDSGKSMHDQDIHDSLIDLNRAGVPLLEMVSEPDIKNSQEAYNYLTEVRKLVRYLEICDGNMEEGSMRCDANISVMPKGSSTFGTKCEVKNMNSIRNVQRAIEFEIKRQIDLIESGGKVSMETRGYDAVSNTTKSQRTKEAAMDYRYFPEPDLQPVFVTEDYIEQVKGNLPPLPNDLYKKYVNELKLSDYDATNITDSKEIALFYEEIVKHTKEYKDAANILMVSVKSYLNENALPISSFPGTPQQLAELIALYKEGKVSKNIALKNIFPLLVETGKNPEEIAKENDWLQEDSSNDDELLNIVKEVVERFPAEIEKYKNGKTNLLQMFMGQVMRETRGKANPQTATKLVKEVLDSK